MTTNDLIALILKDHYNADSLAQLATAIECLQEQMADVATAREKMLAEEDAAWEAEAAADHQGGEDRYLDSYWESLNEIGDMANDY